MEQLRFNLRALENRLRQFRRQQILLRSVQSNALLLRGHRCLQRWRQLGIQGYMRRNQCIRLDR